MASISTLQCSSSILLYLELDKCKVLFDSHIRNPAIFIKVPLQISNSCVDWVKVDDKQGFGRPCTGWRSPQAAFSTSTAILLCPLNSDSPSFPAKINSIKSIDSIFSITFFFHVDECKPFMFNIKKEVIDCSKKSQYGPNSRVNKKDYKMNRDAISTRKLSPRKSTD